MTDIRCWNDLAEENARLREHDEAARKAFAKLAFALDASVKDELAQRGHLRELTAENERLRAEHMAARDKALEEAETRSFDVRVNGSRRAGAGTRANGALRLWWSRR